MMTAAKLRENVYGILDRVLETGTPTEVLHKGRVLRIVPAARPSKLGRLKRRKAYKGDVYQILNMDWLSK